MNFKFISFLLTNILLCQALPHNKRSDVLRGQGDVTYYGEGGSDPAPTGPEGGSPGACGVAPRNSKYFAALNYIQYGEYANPNNSVVCRRCVRVEHGSNQVVVEIVDKCPVCQSGDIDLSPTAFTELFGGLEVGRVHNVNWYEVSCDELGKSNKQTSSSSNNKITTNNKWNEKNIENIGWDVPNVSNESSSSAEPKVSKSVEVVTSTVIVSSTYTTTATTYTTSTTYKTATTTVTNTVTVNSAPTYAAENAAVPPVSTIQSNYEVLIGNNMSNSEEQTCTCIVSICNPSIPVRYAN